MLFFDALPCSNLFTFLSAKEIHTLTQIAVALRDSLEGGISVALMRDVRHGRVGTVRCEVILRFAARP